MRLRFKKLEFEIRGDKILMTKCGSIVSANGCPFVEVQVCGEHKDTHLGIKMVHSSEGAKFRYRSHEQSENCLKIVQESELVRAITTIVGYADTDTIRVDTTVENISSQEIILDEVSAFVAYGIGKKDADSADDLYFTRFQQSHHAECQPRRLSFRKWGLSEARVDGQKRIAFGNVGSWSTKEELPQGIVEDRAKNAFTMFQIESNASWYYEISDCDGAYYLYLGGPNVTFGGWSKKLSVGERYRTVNVALSFGNTLNDTIGEMTKYRRHIAGKNSVDAYLPAIFNEYMYLSWDNPNEAQTEKIARVVSRTGVEYYVIDCGWHDECAASEIYRYVGEWKESKTRFPHGVKKTTDYIRSLGLKAGLWIEPEIIGMRCAEMLGFYDDDCFLQRNGKKIAVMNRYFLDYRNEKVRAQMSETIRRMVEDYGAEYIKCDYNQDCGIGTDFAAFSVGEGLEESAHAFLTWMQETMQRYPQVIFEGCASGGMRMDYKTLSVFSLLSTSDQVDYLQYPYIAGNVLSAVIPEQAAVWSYPVGGYTIGEPCPYDETWVQAHITDDCLAVNMINSFLGRMHLASHLELLSEKQMSYVKEGVSYYHFLTAAKKESLPYFPIGLTSFGADHVAAGFKTARTIYLAVWCLKGAKEICIPIAEGIQAVKLAYPSVTDTRFSYTDTALDVTFARDKNAAFFEIEIK